MNKGDPWIQALGPSLPSPPWGPAGPAWAWNAGQPSPDPASLMPLPNTRPLIRVFQTANVPKWGSRPAIRRAAKSLTFSGLWAFQWEDKFGLDQAGR